MKKNYYFYFLGILLVLLGTVQSHAQINFIEHPVNDSTDGTCSIYATDIDGDIDLDVLVACREDDQILWFRNDGGSPVNWVKIIIGSNVDNAHSVYAADFDNDGDTDVVGAAYEGSPGIAWWRNDGGNPVVWTKFPVAPGFYNAHEVYACDLDKDDDFDILGASSNLNTISWWRNDGGNPIVWTEETISDSVTLAKSVHVADFDNDGDNDVVGAAITAHDVIWWRNDGGSPIQWVEFLVDGNFIGAHRVQAIDMDNDGDYDILGAGYIGHQVAWWRNDGGNPVSWAKQPIGYGVQNACVAYAIDLDKDDDLDVIATAQGGNEISWWRNDGNGSTSWTKFPVTDNFERPWPVFAADFDGDDDIDIISGSSHNGSKEIKWWENDGVVSVLEDQKTNNINICPNPSDDIISIKGFMATSVPLTVMLANLPGETILVKSIPDQNPELNFSLNISNVPNGIYVLKLFGGAAIVTRKVVVYHK